LSDYCLDIDAFDLDQLKTTFCRMVANRDQIKRTMQRKATLYRQQLVRQFDQIFPRTLG